MQSMYLTPPIPIGDGLGVVNHLYGCSMNRLDRKRGQRLELAYVYTGHLSFSNAISRLILCTLAYREPKVIPRLSAIVCLSSFSW